MRPTLSVSSFANLPTLPTGAAGGVGRAFLERGACFGRFVVLHLVGRGAMGEVYAAYDPQLDRKIALKQLNPSPDEPLARARLINEARAAARVSHPNVVTVYDAFDHGDAPFIAMEFVEGQTLTAWLEKTNGDWSQRLAVMLEAGRGLAAAHASGLIHRDFKPDNVFVGGGRVKVGDFGLARLTPLDQPQLPPDAGPRPFSPRLSRTGAVMGTPAYMSLEQLRGQRVDARTDQFSFCAATFEALFGRRPYAGDSLASLAVAISSGAVEEPERSGVPARVLRALRKGLSASADARFADMGALLAELERGAAAGRRKKELAAGATVAALGIFAAAAAARSPPACTGIETRLVGVWDAERRASVERAFLATGAPYAASTWAAVGSALDSYAQRWVNEQTAACEATRVRGEQSDHVLGLRSTCLDQRLRGLDALVDTLASADRAVLERADAAAGKLEPLSACANTAALQARVAPPADAETRALVSQVEQRLARARADLDSGRFEQGLALARAATEEARRIGYRPLQAQASLLAGKLELAAADYGRARESLLTALWAAEAARDDRVATEAYTELTWVSGAQVEKSGENQQWARHAEAALERLGGDPHLEAALAERKSFLLEDRGELEQALQSVSRSVALKEQLYGADDVNVANALLQRGSVLTELGRFDSAIEDAQKALRTSRLRLGPAHPSTGRAELELGRFFMRAGKWAEAELHTLAALANYRAALGGQNLKLVAPLCNAAGILAHEGKLAEALALLSEALELQRALDGDDTTAVAQLLGNRAGFFSALGKHAEEAADLARARDILDQARDPSPVLVAVVTGNHANALLAIGRLEEALAAYEKALAVREKAVGPQHPALAYYLTGIGQVQLQSGTPARGLPALERALTLRQQRGVGQTERAETAFVLAQSLVASGRELARARRLADEARALFLAAGAAGQRRLALVEQWSRARK
jgi:eukaryotic-like serine/threonine-protein kinase